MLKIYQVETDEDVRGVQSLQMEYIDWLGVMFGEYSHEPWYDPDVAELEQEVLDLPGPYCEPEGCLLLAAEEGKMAGCVAIKGLGDGVCEMKRLFVTSEFRGNGIGRGLANATIKQAQNTGYTHMRVMTYERMHQGLGLYLSLGFKRIDRFNDDPIEDVIFMEKEI